MTNDGPSMLRILAQPESLRFYPMEGRIAVTRHQYIGQPFSLDNLSCNVLRRQHRPATQRTHLVVKLIGIVDSLSELTQYLSVDETDELIGRPPKQEEAVKDDRSELADHIGLVRKSKCQSAGKKLTHQF